ncbi:MAG: hypothetical protein HXN53_05905 [Prevotella nigrescens]|nr:hypothetical protein [Prevotella nigrescens]
MSYLNNSCRENVGQWLAFFSLFSIILMEATFVARWEKKSVKSALFLSMCRQQWQTNAIMELSL